MTSAQSSVDSAIKEVDRLRKIVHKSKTKQIRSDDERQVIKATAHTWFNSHRKLLSLAIGDDQLLDLDEEFRGLLAACGGAPSRSKCLKGLKRTKLLLTQLQAEHVVAMGAALSLSPSPTTDTSPDFTTIVGDAKMQVILTNRWGECVKCVDVGAPLAAIVMMGGILEGLLLARINRLSDKSPVFKAKSAPKDRTGTPLKLNEWTLKDYLDVAHELGWITRTTKDIGAVVRDYRNYIHPQKEHSHGINISPEDARMLWQVAKSVARQVLKP